MRKLCNILVIICIVFLVACNMQEQKVTNSDTTSKKNTEDINTFYDTNCDECESSSEIITSNMGDQHNIIYDIKLANYIEGNIFKDSIKVYPIDTYSTKPIESSSKSIIQIGKKQIEAKLISVSTSEYLPDKKLYISDDGNIEYTVNSDNPSFVISSVNDAILATYNKQYAFSEFNLKEQVESFIKSQINIDRLEGYEYTCETFIVCSTSNSSWGETMDEFYVPDCDYERVIFYNFKYQRYHNNIPTDDYIVVRCTPEGNIIKIQYNENNTNWDNKFNSDYIESNVNSFLCKHISDNYEIRNVTIESQQLRKVNNNICLYLEVSISVFIQGQILGIGIPIVVSQ